MIFSKVIFLLTSNVHKFHEVRRVLAEFNIAVAMLNVDVSEVQADDLETIAKASAMEAVKKVNLPIVVEDAGLFVEALNGFPGPYSSYVHRTIGVGGILKLMDGVAKRDAYFESVVAFHGPGREGPICFRGRADGRISNEARGSGGFGFDPIFEPLNGMGRTFAEMSLDEKNEISHRARSFREFARWYKSSFKLI